MDDNIPEWILTTNDVILGLQAIRQGLALGHWSVVSAAIETLEYKAHITKTITEIVHIQNRGETIIQH